MNLLVTGGCGFIGSNFINYFSQTEIIKKLINFDALYYCASHENISEDVKKDKRYYFVKGNLFSSDLVNHVLKEHNITHVVHFAAQSHVQNSFEESLQYTYDNVVGTHTLLECCRQWGKIQKFIHVSTDEVYGETGELVDEKSILIPTNPYAATKAAAEMIAMSYIKSYNLPIIITRGNNVYGPNQYPEKLIPRFIKQLNANEQVTIQGNGSAKRSFLHVLDTCSAFEKILLEGKIGEIYNIGADSEAEYTVMEIAEILVKLMKGTDNYQSYVRFIEDRPFNDARYFISNEKLKALGWKIKIPFMEGIKKLVKLNEV
uniref:NAD(P)-binding domain-containing protein n=1 Tax=viral metagenome TaxID=1070528 RepID=A0A6C0B0P7_9ZZZZ